MNNIMHALSSDNEKLGPFRGIWVMQYETKHQFFKDLIRKLKNINDVSFLLASRN